MIRVTVELVSAIHPSRSRLLGVAIIANDGDERRLYREALEGRERRQANVEDWPRAEFPPSAIGRMGPPISRAEGVRWRSKPAERCLHRIL